MPGSSQGRALTVCVEDGEARLFMTDVALPPLAAHEVRVRTAAVALNYRDIAMISGKSIDRPDRAYIPFSDACGIVEAVGDGVTRWRPGDRVCSLFFPEWIAGALSPESRRPLGAVRDGVGQTMFTAAEQALVAAPSHLSAAEAATLPCAALTAWNAVMHSGAAKPGSVVLVQGTGGVSLFALQFAKMAGAAVLATSSSDAKLQQMRALGADGGINYRDDPQWSAPALSMTDGRGVDLVVEVGGAGTFTESLKAIRLGGAISVVGMLSGAVEPIDVRHIYGRNARIRGVTVGSREMFEAMNRALVQHSIHPVVGRVLPWEEAGAAMEALQRGDVVGKIVLDFGLA